MKKQLLLATALILSIVSFGQTYNKLFKPGSTTGNLNISNTINTLDGGFLSYGGTMYSGSFLIKTNTQGDTSWTKFIQTPSSLPPSILQLQDSSFLISSSATGTASGGIDIFRLGKRGDTIINQDQFTFSGLFGNLGFSEVKSVVNANGEIITAAHQNNGRNLILLTTDSLNNIIDQKSIGLSFLNVPAPTYMSLSNLSILAFPNGDIAISGLSQTDVNDHFYTLTIDTFGNIIWYKTLQTNTSTITNFSPNSMINLPNGNILITGSATINSISGTFLMSVNNSGNVVFAKHINDNAISAKAVSDNTGVIYIASLGADNTIDNGKRVGLYKFLSNGNSIKNEITGLNELTSNGKISNIVLGNDNNLHIGTFSAAGGSLGDLNIFSVNKNLLGSSCQDVALPLNINSFIPSLVIGTPSNMAISTFYSGFTPTLYSTDFTISDLGVFSSGTVTQPLCNGNFGQIDYSITGGTTPYVYTWSNGTNSQNLVNASAGQHNVRVTDANGCVRLDTFAIIEPPLLFATFLKTDVTCFSAFDGSINLTVGGGTPGYSFFWANGAQTEDISTLGGGFYQVTITDTNGCQLTQGISVAEPGPLTASIVSFQDVSCFGLCDGVLTGNASGGTAPYAYLWNDPFNQSSSSADSLCTGNYLLTLTDANGCNAYTSAYVGQPVQLQNNIMTTNASCGVADGGAIVSSTGGVQPYTYIWSNGNSGNTNTNLDAGNYYILGYDANGCGDSAIFQIGVDVYSASICEITVDSTSTKNKVIWEKPIAANIAGFNIYRDVVGLYQLIDFVPYDSLSEYTDASNGIDPSTTSYRYKISTIDTCGNEGTRSAFHETIHLTSNLGLNSEVNLIWDGYKGFQVGYYRIIVDSSNNNIQDYYIKDSVSYSNFTWTDNNPPTGDYLVYAIEVVTPSTCSATKAIDHNTTRSNRATVTDSNPLAIEETILQQTKVYPNPSVGQITIEVNAPNWNYQIMDMGGKQVQNGVSETFNTVLDISYLENGIYMIKIELGSSSIYKKIVKQ